MNKLLSYQNLSIKEQHLYSSICEMVHQNQTRFIFKNEDYNTVGAVFRLVLKDHPEFFWLSGGYSGETLKRGSEETLTFKPNLSQDIASSQIASMRKRFSAVVSEIVAKARTSSGIVYEQVRYVHDYIVLHTEYSISTPQCYNAYGCLVNGKAACAGYAAAFQTVMQAMGVKCGRVVGSSSSKLTGKVDHEWNYIRLDGEYYFVDVTWDDPLMHGSPTKGTLEHSYFFLSKKELDLTHKLSRDQFIPACVSNKYNYFSFYGLFAEIYSFSSVMQIAAKQLRSHNEFAIKFGSERELKRALRDLIDNNKVYEIPGVSRRISYSVSKSGLILKISNQ